MLKPVRKSALLIPGLILVLCLGSSCAKFGSPSRDQEGGDPTENQPTPILGSGDHLANASNAVVNCTAFYQNNPYLIGCAVYIAGSAQANFQSRHMRQQVGYQAGDVEATGFDTGATPTWGALQVDNGGTITSVANVQISANQVEAVYTLPFDLSTEPGATLTLNFSLTTVVNGNPVVTNFPTSVNNPQQYNELSPF